MSRTTQSGWWDFKDSRNAAPEGNISTSKRAERNSRRMATRTGSSSSTTAIRGRVFNYRFSLKLPNPYSAPGLQARSFAQAVRAYWLWPQCPDNGLPGGFPFTWYTVFVDPTGGAVRSAFQERIGIKEKTIVTSP